MLLLIIIFFFRSMVFIAKYHNFLFYLHVHTPLYVVHSRLISREIYAATDANFLFLVYCISMLMQDRLVFKGSFFSKFQKKGCIIMRKTLLLLTFYSLFFYKNYFLKKNKIKKKIKNKMAR
jgi:hypothetical protein